MLKFYVDPECKQEIMLINWGQTVKIRLVDGKEFTLDNAYFAGSIATTTFYVRNEEIRRYAVTSISFPDERVKISIESAWLLPMKPVMITISFTVPSIISPDDMIKADKIKIEGYYIYET